MSSISTTFKIASGFIAASAPAIASAAPVSTGLTLGAIGLSAPWLIAAGVASLPALWWMMRNLPPKPKPVTFPLIALLRDLQTKEQQPARMPFLQRLLMATAIGLSVTGIGGLSWNAMGTAAEEGPVVMVLDNGWASAHQWDARVKSAQGILDRAEKSGRPVAILPTAAPRDGAPIRISGPVSAEEARKILAETKPQPWPVDRAAAADALSSMDKASETSVVWLSSGIDSAGTGNLVEKMKNIGSLTVMRDAPGQTAHLLSRAESNGNDLNIVINRIDGRVARTLQLTVSDDKGNPVQQTEVRFDTGETTAKATFSLPQGIRKSLTRVTINGEPGAGATLLLNEDWKQRGVGLVQTGEAGTIHPLLSETTYIENALKDHTGLHRGNVDTVLAQKPSVLILTDSAIVTDSDQKKISEWVKGGGTLLRFAGPRMAAQNEDNLLSVPLRPGSRNFHNPLTGSPPARIAPFDKSSPFRDLAPPQDVAITQDVMARPDANLDSRTWARLSDGTPLVTAKRENKGWIVLVHTSSNTEWSNLPLSGLFADMLKVIINHGDGGTAPAPDAGASLKPLQTLNGFGKVETPHPAVQNLTGQVIEDKLVGPLHPPGFYGAQELRYAYNLASSVTELKPLPALPDSIRQETYAQESRPVDQAGWQLAASLGLLLGGLLILQKQSGLYTLKQNRPAPSPGQRS